MNPLTKIQDFTPLIFTFTILLIIFHLDSAGQFNEDFSDNDLLTNPQWLYLQPCWLSSASPFQQYSTE
jgi:hypothetical protein